MKQNISDMIKCIKIYKCRNKVDDGVMRERARHSYPLKVSNIWKI